MREHQHDGKGSIRRGQTYQAVDHEETPPLHNYKYQLPKLLISTPRPHNY